ncbi:hypothetical protein EDD85DRAFT_781017, partial [Armillaria nabsnona]
EPFWVYAVATRFGWEDEAEFASKHMRGLSLRDEKNQESLQRISRSSLVFKLHRKAGRASEGYGMGCEVWSVWSVDGSGQHGRLWCGKCFGEWMRGHWELDYFAEDSRVAEDGCLLDEEVSGRGWLVYDRLEVLERARKCLTELLETV